MWCRTKEAPKIPKQPKTTTKATAKMSVKPLLPLLNA